ncbi:MAG TPA: hypothetical protein VNJ29_00820 [Candidatus Nitrosotenuis sp.]|nr:hypothetical protein [Candidatus Nitrosotenuis sp.]
MAYILLFFLLSLKSINSKASELTDLDKAAEKYCYVRQLCKPPLSDWPNHDLGGITIDWEGAVGIAQAVMKSTSLKAISFHLCNMTDLTAKPLLLSFINHPTLEKVDLGFNDFRSESHKLLAEVINNNITLKSLDLSMTNFIGDQTTRLFEAVYMSPSLKELIFDLNIFEFEAAKKLSALKEPNTSLERLSLSFASVSSRALTELSCNIHQLKALKSLNLSANLLTDKDAEVMALLAYHSQTLEELDLSNNNLTSSFVHHFQKQWSLYPKDKKQRPKPLTIYLTKKSKVSTYHPSPIWSISSGPRPVYIL